MNIAQIKQLDVGMAGIGCSGQVTWAGKSEHKTGVSGGEPYDFWSQFIVIADNTEKIGVQINNPPPNGVAKDDTVTIEKAKLKSYIDKDNKTVLKLQGKLAIDRPPQEAQQPPQQAAQRPNSAKPDWDAIAEGKVRHGLVCAYIQAGKEPMVAEVNYWMEFIVTGKAPLPPSNQPESLDYAKEGSQSSGDEVPF